MTAEQIRRSALKQFARLGYHGASLSQIAAEVGIRKQSIATYYSSKESLYLAVCEDAFQEYLAFMEQVQQHADLKKSEDKLLWVLKQNIQYRLEHADFTAFLNHLIHFPPDFLRGHIISKIQWMEEQSAVIYRELFLEGMANGEISMHPVEELLAAYYCIIDGMSVQMQLYEREQLDRKLASIWGIFWQGLKT